MDVKKFGVTNLPRGHLLLQFWVTDDKGQPAVVIEAPRLKSEVEAVIKAIAEAPNMKAYKPPKSEIAKGDAK